MTKPSHNTTRAILFLAIALVMLSTLFGLWSHYNLADHNAETVALKSATLFDQPRIIHPFTLTDDHNQPFTLTNLKGHYSLIFFGFTHCPDLCPTTLATLNQSYTQLQKAHLKILPQIVFISVDPERDSPEVIKRYLSSFNPAFLGATGTTATLNHLTQDLSVLYTKVFQEDGKHYTMDHSGTLILVNPKGEYAGVFTLPHDAKKIADDMSAIVNRP